MRFNISEFCSNSHATEQEFEKRDAFFNFGGSDKSQSIKGNHNKVFAPTENPATEGQETLLRKTGHQVGRIIESGADLATAPAQWLKSVIDNWYDEFYQ